MTVVPLLPSLNDEPFSDSTQIPICLTSKLAREHVPVALSGDGGVELFAGYDRYFFAHGLLRGFGRLPAAYATWPRCTDQCSTAGTLAGAPLLRQELARAPVARADVSVVAEGEGRCRGSHVRLSFVRPGRPNEYAYIESLNGKFRDECRNEYWFLTMSPERRVIETGRAEHNTERPHSLLGDLTPEGYANWRIVRRHEAISFTADSNSAPA